MCCFGARAGDAELKHGRRSQKHSFGVAIDGHRPAGHVVWDVGAENSLYTRGQQNTVPGPSGPLLVVFNKVLLAHGWACLSTYRLWLLSRLYGRVV